LLAQSHKARASQPEYSSYLENLRIGGWASSCQNKTPDLN